MSDVDKKRGPIYTVQNRDKTNSVLGIGATATLIATVIYSC